MAKNAVMYAYIWASFINPKAVPFFHLKAGDKFLWPNEQNVPENIKTKRSNTGITYLKNGKRHHASQKVAVIPL